jgi:predicted DNA-binding transcriptional regulator AlpA
MQKRQAVSRGVLLLSRFTGLHLSVVTEKMSHDLYANVPKSVFLKSAAVPWYTLAIEAHKASIPERKSDFLTNTEQEGEPELGTCGSRL